MKQLFIFALLLLLNFLVYGQDIIIDSDISINSCDSISFIIDFSEITPPSTIIISIDTENEIDCPDGGVLISTLDFDAFNLGNVGPGITGNILQITSDFENSFYFPNGSIPPNDMILGGGISDITININNSSGLITGFISCECLSALSVELTYFKAENKEEFIKLTWKTASETNSDYFNVLLSQDASNYDSEGTVQASGNSSFEILYEFNSYSEFIDNYYKLIECDINGVEVEYGPIYIERNKNVDYQYFDLIGRPIKEYNLEHNRFYLRKNGSDVDKIRHRQR